MVVRMVWIGDSGGKLVCGFNEVVGVVGVFIWMFFLLFDFLVLLEFFEVGIFCVRFVFWDVGLILDIVLEMYRGLNL